MQLFTHPRWTAARLPTPGVPEDADILPDGDLVPLYAVVWVASLARVVVAMIHHEPFGTEVTVAALATVLFPLLLLASIRWLLRQLWRHRTETDATEDKLGAIVRLVPGDRISSSAQH